MTKSKPSHENDPRLEMFFEAERTVPAPASAGLLNRVLRDSLDLQPSVPTAEKPANRRAALFGFFRSSGGWRAASVLALCLCVGVSLGYQLPDTFGDIALEVLDPQGSGALAAEYGTLDDLVWEG
ncbi:MAG: hypothetical protein ACE5DK_02620 [Paracoccaceae bacterium]